MQLGVFLVGRKPRFEYPGGVYHLIQRGNNREYIFEKTEDKEFLLELIKECKEIMKFEIFGYVIMGNHYHLIIKTSEAPLRDIMHRINNKFSRNYNTRNKRTGHVFENRYKGILVIDDRYLLSLLRYVHQNPISAHMCKSITDYTWSSDKYYRTNNNQEIVDIDFILNVFANDRMDAIRTYIDFMDENKKEDVSVFENVDVIGKVNTNKIDEYIKSDTKSLDQILHDITKDIKIYNEIKLGSRKRYLSSYKKEYVNTAIKANYTMKEIGEHISISDVAIFKIHNS